MSTVSALSEACGRLAMQRSRCMMTTRLRSKAPAKIAGGGAGARIATCPSALSSLAAPPGLDGSIAVVEGSGGALAIAAITAAAAAAVASVFTPWKVDTGIAECSSLLDDIGGNAYEPGQAVGVGIKAELWKTKHPNFSVLETGEDSPVLGLMSLVRNAETEGSAFVSAANRLMRQLLDFAVMGLPSDEEAVFVTPTRVMMEGVLPQDDIQVCAISLYLEHEPTGVFDDELAMAFSSFETGNLRVRGLTRGSGKELPRNMEGKQVLLLAPVVGYSQPVLAALERLEQVGVQASDVTLVSVVISKDAVETLTDEAEDMAIVCGAMDGETRGIDHQVIPGVGNFSERYFEAKKVAKADALKNKQGSIAGNLRSGKRRWWQFWRRGT